VPCGAAGQDATPVARAQFRRGTELFNARNYAEALEAFRASMAAYASPNARLYVARCLAEMGRLGEAVEQYERAAGEANDRAFSDPRYLAARDAAREELRELSPRVGRLTVRAQGAPPPPGARLRVAGRELPPTALGVALPVSPGAVEVSLEAPGCAPSRAIVTVARGRQAEARLGLRCGDARAPSTAATPPEGAAGNGARAPGGVGRGGANGGDLSRTANPARALRTAGWASLAAGGAAFATAAVFALLADALYRDIRSRCPPDCRTSDLDAANVGEAYQTVTNVSLALGAAGVAAAAIFLFLPVRGERDATTRASRASVRLLGTGLAVAF
jgi:tetratricopeptide (TPR) repeat protein